MIEVASDNPEGELVAVGRTFGTKDRPDRQAGHALTEMIVEQHGGQLQVSGTEGTTFYAQLRLPLRK